MEFGIKDNAAELRLLSAENGIEYYVIEAPVFTGSLHIEWSEPMAGHYSVWHPLCGRWRQLPQWFCAQKAESCFYRGAPVIATFSADGGNMVCASLSDSFSPVSLGFYVDDFSGRNEVMFTLDIEVRKSPYSAVLRIDRSGVSFADAVHNAALWWNEKITKTVPEEAYSPLYSSWYSFHQDPTQEKLTEELKVASELGFRTFILDDGWQIEGGGTKDYLRSGDWTVAKDKFPDFGKFVDDVHSFGMKFMLWFAVPFAGFETQAYRRFRDKLLYEQGGFINAGILDIRYPGVREYITDTYARFVKDYGIDGLKLDFIDNFKCYENTPAYNPAMDCETVEDAVVALLNEIEETVTALKPGFLFEYRQFYVGPSILKYGNMIRVADCAFDSLTNRIGVADLRIMTDTIAVHSDMLLWSPEETPVNCEMQLLDVMFSAVQVSVLPTQATQEQKKLLKAFTDYACRNRDVLLKGHFSVSHPELNYTRLTSEIKEKNRRITVLYANEAYEYGGMNEDVWNGCFAEEITVINRDCRKIRITVRAFTGGVSAVISSSQALLSVPVPAAGMLEITEER